MRSKAFRFWSCHLAGGITAHAWCCSRFLSGGLYSAQTSFAGLSALKALSQIAEWSGRYPNDANDVLAVYTRPCDPDIPGSTWRQQHKPKKSEQPRLMKPGPSKSLANATSYGIFVELNVRRPVAGIQVQIQKIREAGQIFHPLLGTLITCPCSKTYPVWESVCR